MKLSPPDEDPEVEPPEPDKPSGPEPMVDSRLRQGDVPVTEEVLEIERNLEELRGQEIQALRDRVTELEERQQKVEDIEAMFEDLEAMFQALAQGQYRIVDDMGKDKSRHQDFLDDMAERLGDD